MTLVIPKDKNRFYENAVIIYVHWQAAPKASLELIAGMPYLAFQSEEEEMPNGKPGDDLLLDIVRHKIPTFTPEIDQLICEICELGGAGYLVARIGWFADLADQKQLRWDEAGFEEQMESRRKFKELLEEIRLKLTSSRPEEL